MTRVINPPSSPNSHTTFRLVLWTPQRPVKQGNRNFDKQPGLRYARYGLSLMPNHLPSVLRPVLLSSLLSPLPPLPNRTLQKESKHLTPFCNMSSVKEPIAGPGQSQPWRTWWPPTGVENMTEEELKAKPWINWRPDPQRPTAKPWLKWVPRDVHIVHSHPDQGPTSPRPSSPKPPPASSSNAEGG